MGKVSSLRESRARLCLEAARASCVPGLERGEEPGEKGKDGRGMESEGNDKMKGRKSKMRGMERRYEEKRREKEEEEE